MNFVIRATCKENDFVGTFDEVKAHCKETGHGHFDQLRDTVYVNLNSEDIIKIGLYFLGKELCGNLDYTFSAFDELLADDSFKVDVDADDIVDAVESFRRKTELKKIVKDYLMNIPSCYEKLSQKPTDKTSKESGT